MIHILQLSLCLLFVPLNGNVLQFGKRLGRGLIDVVHRVTLIDCIEECLFRKRCLSVNYWRSVLLCEMNSETGNLTALTDDFRTVFTDVQNWDKVFKCQYKTKHIFFFHCCNDLTLGTFFKIVMEAIPL